MIWESSYNKYKKSVYKMGLSHGRENIYAKYGQPALDLQFSGPKGSIRNRADGGAISVEFTRTQDTPSSYIKSDGIIGYAATDVPRFDHDPATGESLGLLVEESRTDYSPRVYGFIKNGSTGKEVYGYTLPDGTVGRLKYHAYITASSYEIYQSVDSVGGVGVNHVHSYYVKNISGYTVSFRYGVIGGQTATIPDDGKWHRLIVDNYVANGLNRIYNMYVCTSGGSATDPSVSGPMELLFWGENIEAGSFVTSYIPTPATFTSRASEATYYNQNGIVSIASTDVARDDAYFPDENGNFISAGLLLEGERTNLFPISETYASWNVDNNATVATDGTTIAGLTAVKLTSNIDTNALFLEGNNATFTASTTYTASVYHKPGNVDGFWFEIRQYTGGGTPKVYFDSTTETWSADSGTFNGQPWSVKSQKVESNAWRHSITFYIATDTAGTARIGGLGPVNSTNVSTGDYGYIAAPQLEDGSFPTSYIPTAGIATTRAADISSSSISTRGADTASMNASPYLYGTFLAKYKHQPPTGLARQIFSVGAANAYGAFVCRTITNDSVNIVLPGVIELTSTANTEISGFNSVAAARVVGDYAVCLNGGTVAKTSSTSDQTNNSVITFMYGTIGATSGGHISRLTYWPTRLPDSDLQRLTE
jgi:hypothetical protein